MRQLRCALGLHVFEWGGHYLALTHTTRDTRSMRGPQLACHWCDKTIGQQDVASGSLLESIAFPLGCLLVAAGLALVRFCHPAGSSGWIVVTICAVGVGFQTWAASWSVRRYHYFRHLTAATDRKRDKQR